LKVILLGGLINGGTPGWFPIFPLVSQTLTWGTWINSTKEIKFIYYLVPALEFLNSGVFQLLNSIPWGWTLILVIKPEPFFQGIPGNQGSNSNQTGFWKPGPKVKVLFFLVAYICNHVRYMEFVFTIVDVFGNTQDQTPVTPGFGFTLHS